MTNEDTQLRHLDLIDLDNITQMSRKLADRLDSIELLFHSLLMAYMELWATTETLVKNFFNQHDSAVVEEFRAMNAKLRKALWNEIKEAGNSQMDPETAAAVEKFIKGV